MASHIIYSTDSGKPLESMWAALPCSTMRTLSTHYNEAVLVLCLFPIPSQSVFLSNSLSICCFHVLALFFFFFFSYFLVISGQRINPVPYNILQRFVKSIYTKQTKEVRMSASPSTVSKQMPPLFEEENFIDIIGLHHKLFFK